MLLELQLLLQHLPIFLIGFMAKLLLMVVGFQLHAFLIHTWLIQLRLKQVDHYL
jgi:hypothetical protein